MKQLKILMTTALIGGTLLFAPNVAATAAYSDCASDKVCLWGNNDYKWLIHTRNPGKGLLALTGDANNEMDSWGNRTTKNARGYDKANGTGDCQTFAKGSKDNNVAPWNSDEISSTASNGKC